MKNIREIPDALFHEFVSQVPKSLLLVVKHGTPHYTSLEMYRELVGNHPLPCFSIYAGTRLLEGTEPRIYGDVVYVEHNQCWDGNCDIPEGQILVCKIIIRARELVDSGEFQFEKCYRLSSEEPGGMRVLFS